MPEIDLLVTGLSLVLVFAAQVLLVRDRVSGVLDPLFYFVVTSSFAMTFAVASLNDVLLIIRVYGYFLAFWLGFFYVLGSKKTLMGRVPHVDLRMDGVFPVLVTVGVGFLLILNVFAWASAGVPIFSTDPSLQKVESLTGGLGLVRRFNWGVGVFLFVAAIYWAIYERSWMAKACFVVVALVSVLGGSKSAFLPVLFSVGLYLLLPFRTRRGQLVIDAILSGGKYLLLFAIIPVVAVFLLESEDVASALTAFGVRLLYFGDALLFWGREDVRDHFSLLNRPIDYPVHLFGSILGAIRLVPYETPLGNQFVQFTLRAGEELSGSLGPNTPFYVKGELFFGVLFAPIYAFFVGCVVAMFRAMFLGLSSATMTRYSLFASLLVLSMTLPTEDALFIGRLADFLLFLLPVYVIAQLLHKGGRFVRSGA